MKDLPLDLDVVTLGSTVSVRMPFSGTMLGFRPGTALLCFQLVEDWEAFKEGDVIAIDFKPTLVRNEDRESFETSVEIERVDNPR